VSSAETNTVVSGLQRFYTGSPQFNAIFKLAMSLPFNEAKATQTAAAILRMRGGRMHYIKLIKLLYLVDREALLNWGTPITTDHWVAMKNGPVGSNVLNLITEETREKPIWSKYISPPLGDWEVELTTNGDVPNDCLSRAEENLIKQVYEKYGHRNRWDLIDNVMHKLPEWTDPQGSSIPISVRDILESSNEKPEEIKAITRELRMMGRTARVLSGT
jgi:uncharacterized phage-associated protein